MDSKRITFIRKKANDILKYVAPSSPTDLAVWLKESLEEIEKLKNPWVNVLRELPPVGERVLVKIKYAGNNYWEWTESEIEDEQFVNTDFHYKEPITKKYWMMGSAKDYRITHWMRIELP